MNPPVRTMVSRTPSEDRTIPCRRTGFVSWSEVSRPPANRMIVMAKCPMYSAM